MPEKEKRGKSSDRYSSALPLGEARQDMPKRFDARPRVRISRRTFLKATVGASTVLAGATFATSPDFLTFATLEKEKRGPQVIANAVDLENEYLNVKSNPLAYAWRFFYWPYSEDVSVYYKNVLFRLPDSLVADPGPTPSLSHYRALNTTCVHLRCIVNPGVEDGEDRLKCPCHGSQYRIIDGVPVKGPAFLLNLGRLPHVELDLVGNDIIAKNLEGIPGIGLH